MQNAEPQSTNRDVSRWQKRRKLALIALIGGSAAFGIADLLLRDRGFTKFLSLAFALVWAALVLLWCVYDSHIRGYTLGGPSRLFIFLIGLVGVPLYFFRSRSRREWIRSGFGLFLVWAPILPYYGTWYLLRFILIQVGYYE